MIERADSSTVHIRCESVKSRLKKGRVTLSLPRAVRAHSNRQERRTESQNLSVSNFLALGSRLSTLDSLAAAEWPR